jgi:predicted dehydrogenase
MSRRLKVGVVGGGVGIAHLDAYRELPDLYSVEAFCDIDAERAGKVAAEKAIPKSVTRFEDMLALDLDIIDIATPSNFHFPQATAILEAGHNAVVEKPVAASLAEVDALKATERKSGKRLAPIFQYRFANGLRKFLHLKAKGLVGKPYVATVETHWRRTAAYYDNPWRGRWRGEIGGCLITHAIHAHDILTEALGPVAGVFARTSTLVNDIEKEDCVAAALEMASGALVTLSVTLGSDKEISRLRLVFDGLVVESNLAPYDPGFEPWTFTASDAAAQKRIDEALADFVPAPQRWVGQFAQIHAALTGGGPLAVTLDDARASVELPTAIYYSSHVGEAVTLPIGDDHPFYRGWVETMATSKSGGS